MFSTTAGSSTAGFGAQPIYKYVYFYDAAALTGTMQVAPAPVYYIDESFTTVTRTLQMPITRLPGRVWRVTLCRTPRRSERQIRASDGTCNFRQAYVQIQVGGFLRGVLWLRRPDGGSAGQLHITALTTGSWTSRS